MVANMPYDSAKRAVASLHIKDLAMPLTNQRRGQVWAVSKTASPPIDGRLANAQAQQPKAVMGRLAAFARLRWSVVRGGHRTIAVSEATCDAMPVSDALVV